MLNPDKNEYKIKNRNHSTIIRHYKNYNIYELLNKVTHYGTSFTRVKKYR